MVYWEIFRALFACHFAQGFFDKSMNWTPTFFHDQFPMMKDQVCGVVYIYTPMTLHRLGYTMSHHDYFILLRLFLVAGYTRS